jgi:hypothetical protein
MKTYGQVSASFHQHQPRHYTEVSEQIHEPAALGPKNQARVPIGLEVEWASGPV